MEPGDPRVGTAVGLLAAGLLIAVLIAVISIAKYDALVSEAHAACQSAAALDLSSWVKLCKMVNFQE